MMTMPRPSKKVKALAEKVIPGMKSHEESIKYSNRSRGSMSEVEVKQTNAIESKKGLS